MPARTLRLSTSVAALVVFGALAPAQNDECTGAIPVNVGSTSSLSNVGATTSIAPGGCGNIGADVWFSHVATCTGTLTASTCGATSFDTVLEVFSGSCGALTSLGCNDDACGTQSVVAVPVTSGSTYYLRVGGFSGATGTFVLNLTCTGGSTGRPDDNCTGATAINLGTNGPFSNVGYTTSPPNWPCAPSGNDRWFSFTASVSGPHTIQTCSSTRTVDTVIEVFSGSCTALSSIACNDDSCGLGSSVQVNLTSGSTYLIRVGGYSSAVGNFDVEVTIGNGTGSVRLATTSGCGTNTITFQGQPALGSSFTTNLGNITGAPLIGIGFVNPNQLFCGCSFGTDWSTATFGSTLNLSIPANPSYLNVRFYVQGADVGASGGCGYVLYTLTDSYEVTIG